MKPDNDRKASPKEQQIVNPGPVRNARVYRTTNPSGVENKSMPRGRGEPSNDSSATEKQSQ